MTVEKQIEKWMETLPYPAVAISAEKNGVSRNRLARRLLPPVSRLRGQLLSGSEDFIREMRLDGIAYTVLTLPAGEEERLFCFFEHFLPLEEAFSRAIVGKMQDFFWSLLSKEGEFDAESPVRLDRIAARVCSLRMHGENYLRLINKGEIHGTDEAKTCSLGGFFGHLHKALDAFGIPVSFRACDEVTVYSESTVLSFLVLNLIQFAHLFEAEKDLCLEVSEEGEGVRFSMEISDRGEVKSSLENLILCGKESEKILFTLPMLCVLRVCMEKGIPWSVTEREGKITFSFLMAKGEGEPALFLSDAVAPEVSELLQMIKVMFS